MNSHSSFGFEIDSIISPLRLISKGTFGCNLVLCRFLPFLHSISTIIETTSFFVNNIYSTLELLTSASKYKKIYLEKVNSRLLVLTSSLPQKDFLSAFETPLNIFFIGFLSLIFAVLLIQIFARLENEEDHGPALQARGQFYHLAFQVIKPALQN